MLPFKKAPLNLSTLNDYCGAFIKTHHNHFLKHFSLITCLFISSSSIAQQPPAAATKSAKPTPLQPAATKCPALSELFGVFGQKKFYAQSAETFLHSLAGQIKSTKDDTKRLRPSEKLRTISLGATSGDWLVSGEANYRVFNGRTEFNSLSLKFNKSCFSAAEEFIAQGKNAIGKDGEAVALDDTQMIMWRWKDPDISLGRIFEVYASPAHYSIAARRDPDTSGAGG